MGVSKFSTVLSDSPSFQRSLVEASPSAFRTFSFPSAVTCSSARESPVLQFTAVRPRTYWLPKLAIEPPTYALLPARWQSSRTMIGVSGASAG